MQLSTGRRSPRIATSRGRRKDATTMTPAHRGRAATGQGSCSLIQSVAVSTCCQFWFAEWAPVRDLNAAEPETAVAEYRDTARQGRREDGTTVDSAYRGRAASGLGFLYCTWSRGPGRACGTRCSAFAESSRSGGKTRPHTDAAAVP